MASTVRRPPPPPRTSSTIALAACSGRLPRITLIFSERPSASCSITRNFALASPSRATSRSKTSATPDHLVRQKFQCLVEPRHLAVGRCDGGLDAAPQGLLGGHRHLGL